MILNGDTRRADVPSKQRQYEQQQQQWQQQEQQQRKPAMTARETAPATLRFSIAAKSCPRRPPTNQRQQQQHA